MTRVLTGSNLYALQNELQKIVSEFRNNYGEGIERFDAQDSDADDILNAVRTLSLFDTNKLVIVRDFSQNKEIYDKLPIIIEQTNDTVQLVLIDSKIDKRSSSFTTLKKIAEVTEFKNADPYNLGTWVAQFVSESGGQISSSDARYLVERVGSDQLRLSQEIKKLVTFSSVVNRKSIDNLTDMSPSSSIFQMLEALFNGNGSMAWKLYQEQRTLGEEPHKIMAMITWQLQQLTLAAYVSEPAVQNLSEAGMSSYSAQKNLKIVSKISKRRLRYFVSSLFILDLQVKTNAYIESALAVYFADVGRAES